MNKKYEYKTELVKGRNNAVYAAFPYDCFAEFGSRKAIPVKVSFDDNTYRMSLLPGGNKKHWLHIRKEIRQKIGKQDGDMVFITLEKDNEPRLIEIPEYLKWLFDDEPEMGVAFHKLPAFYQKFWINTIEETNNGETKVERINKLFNFLKSGGKTGV